MRIFLWGIQRPLLGKLTPSGPTQELSDAIFCKNLVKTTEILTANPTLINLGDQNGDTPLHKALRDKNIDPKLIQLLLDKGAKLDINNNGIYHDNQLMWSGETPLHEALEENENITPEIIELLFNKDPNLARVKDKSGDSLLDRADRNPNMTEEMIDLLIDNGVPLDRRSSGSLPLAVMRAANGGNLAAFKRLFEKTPGIDVNTKTPEGSTFL